MYYWFVSWANQAFKGSFSIIDHYVAENRKREGLFFRDFKAHMSSSCGMTL